MPIGYSEYQEQLKNEYLRSAREYEENGEYEKAADCYGWACHSVDAGGGKAGLEEKERYRRKQIEMYKKAGNREMAKYIREMYLPPWGIGNK